MVYQYDHFPGDIFHGALHPFPTWTDVLEVGGSAVLGSSFTIILLSTSLLSRVEPMLSFILGAAQPALVLRGSPEILPVRKRLTACVTQFGEVKKFRNNFLTDFEDPHFLRASKVGAEKSDET